MTNDFDIDLRKYVLWVLNSWVWIISLTLIAALSVFLFSIFQPRSYRALAMVIVTRSIDTFRFDSKINSNQVQPNYNAYLDFADSDQLKYVVYQQLTSKEQETVSYEQFQSSLATVEKGTDDSTIIFSVTLEGAEQAAKLANFWANLFVKEANQFFSGEDQTQLLFFQDQLALAIESKNKADQALADFQATNKLSVLSNQLNSLYREQNNYLALLQNNANLEQNVSDFRDNIASKPNGSSLAQAEELTVLLMQIQTYNSQLSGSFPSLSSSTGNMHSPGSLSGSDAPQDEEDVTSLLPSSSSSTNNIQSPLQINVDTTNLSSTSSSSALVALDQVLLAIDQQKIWTEKRLTELEPRILSLQQDVQSFYNQQNNLIQSQKVAFDTVVSLSRKVEEVRISLDYSNTSGPVKVSSEANVPTKPVSRNLIINTALAGAIGFILGVLGVFLKNWWQESEILSRKTLATEHS